MSSPDDQRKKEDALLERARALRVGGTPPCHSHLPHFSIVQASPVRCTRMSAASHTALPPSLPRRPCLLVPPSQDQAEFLAKAFSWPAEEPARNSCHWDYVLKEARWLAEDFMQVRRGAAPVAVSSAGGQGAGGGAGAWPDARSLRPSSELGGAGLRAPGRPAAPVPAQQHAVLCRLTLPRLPARPLACPPAIDPALYVRLRHAPADVDAAARRSGCGGWRLRASWLTAQPSLTGPSCGTWSLR